MIDKELHYETQLSPMYTSQDDINEAVARFYEACDWDIEIPIAIYIHPDGFESVCARSDLPRTMVLDGNKKHVVHMRTKWGLFPVFPCTKIAGEYDNAVVVIKSTININEHFEKIVLE